MRRVDQRLNFDQQRPGAFLRDQHTRSGDRFGVLRQKQRRRIRHAFEPLLGHRKYAEFIYGAKPILNGANQPEARMRIAFEVKHGVDDVFEHAWARERALFRYMADQDHSYAARLGEPRQLRRALTDLRDRAGR